MFLDAEIVRKVEEKSNSYQNRLMSYCNDCCVRIGQKIFSSPKKLIVGILITERCNLDCIYCYEKYKTNKTVTLAKAQDIISHVLSANSIWTDVEFRLLGGEPLIVSNLIIEIIEWTFKKQWNKRFQFKIATNGTLVDEKMKLWVDKYKNKVCFILSLDGPAFVHNKNRKDSYSDIDFIFFSNTWPKQSVKMTVSKESISELFNSVVYIYEKLGLNVSFNLAGGQKWNNDDLIVFENEQKKLLVYYSRKKIDLPPIYKVNFARIHSSTGTLRHCGIGQSVVVYDTDGNSFPCHLFLPNVIQKVSIPSIKELSDDDFLKDNYCQGCAIENICPTCYAFNFLERGKVNDRDHSLCNFYKMIIKYSAILKMIRYSNQRFLSKDELKEINAILYLNENFDN